MVVSFSSEILQSALTNQKTLKMVQHVLSLVNIGRHKLFINREQAVLYGELMDKLIIYEEIIKKYADFSDKVKPDFFVVIDKTGNIMQFEKKYNISETCKIRMYETVNKVSVKTFNSAWNYECEFIDINDYYSYVCDNLKIMLEDKVSDGGFLNAVIKAYKNSVLGEDFDVEAIDIEGCAGCVSRNMKAVTKHSRIFSFVDSDRKHKKLRPSDGKDIEQKKLLSLANAYGYKILFLKKKEIENYIPDRLLKEFKPEHIYHSFNDEQKAFFDLKFGLKIRDFESNLVLELYKNVLKSKDITAIKEYRNQFTKHKNSPMTEKLGERVLIDGFGKDVYQLFYNDIAKQEFDKIDYYNEFKDMLKFIKRYT